MSNVRMATMGIGFVILTGMVCIWRSRSCAVTVVACRRVYKACGARNVTICGIGQNWLKGANRALTNSR